LSQRLGGPSSFSLPGPTPRPRSERGGLCLSPQGRSSLKGLIRRPWGPLRLREPARMERPRAMNTNRTNERTAQANVMDLARAVRRATSTPGASAAMAPRLPELLGSGGWGCVFLPGAPVMVHGSPYHGSGKEGNGKRPGAPSSWSKSSADMGRAVRQVRTTGAPVMAQGSR